MEEYQPGLPNTQPDPDEILLLDHVKKIPVAMANAMNERQWDLYKTFLARNHQADGWLYTTTPLTRTEMAQQLAENAKINPNWFCKAVDVTPHMVRRDRNGQITVVDIYVSVKHYNAPTTVVRSLFIILTFGVFWNEQKQSSEWLCTKQRIVPGLHC